MRGGAPVSQAGVLTNQTTQYADLFLPHVGCNGEEDASRRWAAVHDDGS
jgi:hypothetical protein